MDAITSLLMRWAIAVWAGGMNVAMASTVKALPGEALWNEKTWMVEAMFLRIELFFEFVSFGLDDTVNSILPRSGGVMIYFIRHGHCWPVLVAVVRGSQLLAVDVDMDIQVGLGDVSFEGACEMGVVGIDLGILSQEVGRENVGVG